MRDSFDRGSVSDGGGELEGGSEAGGRERAGGGDQDEQHHGARHGEGDAPAGRAGEQAAADDGAAEAPGLDRVDEAEGATVEPVGDQPLEQHPVADHEQGVAGAGDGEGQHREADNGSERRADEPRHQQRDAGEVAAADAHLAVVAGAQERARDQPAPVGAGEQGEAGAAGSELLLGEDELGDVHRAGDEHDRPGPGHLGLGHSGAGEHERAIELLAESMVLASRAGDPAHLSSTVRSLARAQLLGASERSPPLELLKESLALSRDLGERLELREAVGRALAI